MSNETMKALAEQCAMFREEIASLQTAISDSQQAFTDECVARANAESSVTALEHSLKMAERDYGEIIEEKNSKIAALEALALELAKEGGYMRNVLKAHNDCEPHSLGMEQAVERFDAALSSPLLAELRAKAEDDDCPNCFEGKSDMDHTCLRCNGTGKRAKGGAE